MPPARVRAGKVRWVGTICETRGHSGWGETMKLTTEFLQNVSAKFRDFEILKVFWNFEICNINSIKLLIYSIILWNSGKIRENIGEK